MEMAIQRRERGHAEKIVHPRCIACPQRKVRVCTTGRDVVPRLLALAPLHSGAISACRAGRQIRLDANDRLDPRITRLRPKLKGTKQVPVVGHRYRALPKSLNLVEEFP